MTKKDWINISLTIILVVATVSMAWATLQLANETTKVTNISQEILKQERLFNSPYLVIWDAEDNPRALPKDRLIVSGVGWADDRQICLRNDGRTSTGPVNIIPESSKFTVEYTYFPNIPPGEGNCTSIRFVYYHCPQGESCDEFLVPTGIIHFNFSVTCSLCDFEPEFEGFDICVYSNQSEFEVCTDFLDNYVPL